MAKKKIVVTEQISKPTIQPGDAEKALIDLFRNAASRIERRILEAKIKGNQTAYLEAMLRDVRAEWKALVVMTEGWASTMLWADYQAGIQQANEYYIRQYKDYDKIVPAGTEPLGYPPAFSVMHREALRILVSDVQAKLSGTIYRAGRHIEGHIREIGKAVIEHKIATGSTIKQTAAMLRDEFEQKQLHAIPMKNGRTMTMEAYAKLVARSTTREATNLGNATQVKQLGGDLVKMTSHFPTCPVCLTLQGRVYSITGENENYPRLTMAWSGGYANVHPNCRHVFVPYIIELKDDDQIRADQDFSNRPWDIDDWDEKQKAKAEASLAAYNKDQARKAKLYRDRRDWQFDRAEYPDETPKTLAGYRRSKTANGPAWQKLQETKKAMKKVYEQTGEEFILVDKVDGRVLGFPTYMEAIKHRSKMRNARPDLYDETRLDIFTGNNYTERIMLDLLPMAKGVISDITTGVLTEAEQKEKDRQAQMKVAKALGIIDEDAIKENQVPPPPMRPFGGWELTEMSASLARLYQARHNAIRNLEVHKGKIRTMNKEIMELDDWQESYVDRKNALPWDYPMIEPSEVETIEEAREVARDKYGLDLTFEGLEMREVNDILDGLEGLHQVFGQVPSVRSMAEMEAWERDYNSEYGDTPMDPRTYGVCTSKGGPHMYDGNEIGIRNYIGTPFKVEMGEIKSYVQDYYQWQEKMDILKHIEGYISTGSAQHVVVHEMGHALFNDIVNNPDTPQSLEKLRKMTDLFAELTQNSFIWKDPDDAAKLSVYGLTNMDEMAAECIAELVLGYDDMGEEPRDIAQRFYKILTGTDLEDEELDKLIAEAEEKQEKAFDILRDLGKLTPELDRLITSATERILDKEKEIEAARAKAVKLAAEDKGRTSVGSIYDWDYIKTFENSSPGKNNEFNQWLIEADNHARGLTPTEKEAVNNATGSKRMGMEHYVLTGEHARHVVSMGEEVYTRAMTQTMDRLTTQAPVLEENTIFYGALDPGDPNTVGTMFGEKGLVGWLYDDDEMSFEKKEEKFNAALKGAVFTNNIHQSISFGKSYENVDPIHLEIYIPKGYTPGLYAQGLQHPTMSKPNRIIAPRGQQYQIFDIDVTQDPYMSGNYGRVTVKVMLMGQEEKDDE